MPLKAGVSGNPSGRRKLTEQDRDDLAYLRKHASKACKRLVQMIDDSDSRTALAAAREILDRAWGKAVQQTESRVEIDSRIAMRAEIRAALVAEAEGRLTAIDAIDAMPAIDGAQSTD